MNNNDEKILNLHNQGVEVKDIIKGTGLSRSKVYQVIHNAENGIEVTYAKRGRKYGEKRLLTPEQEQIIYKQLLKTTPDEYSFTDSKLWTRKNICSLIGELDVIVSDHTVLNYLKRFKLLYPRHTPSDPLLQGKEEAICISVAKLKTENSTTFPQSDNKEDVLTYILYTYDKKGTYYFRCYSEDSLNNNKHLILYMVHDFISRITDLNPSASIVCLLPAELHDKNLRRTWVDNTFNKLISEERIFFNKMEETNE